MQDHGKKIFLISIGVVVAVILAFFGYQGYKAKMEEKRHAEYHETSHSSAVEYIKAGKWDYASYTLESLDEDRCVDCDTFLLYAYAMIKYKNGQADNAGIESAHDWFEQISTDYSGELADDIRRVYRIARPVDMEKYQEAKSREHATMIESRQIAKGLGLKMKIGDVEYQGDCNKAIFYYIADERVDFRQLIKDLAATFHVRIEMKQIGARQEAGLIGGTGPCGRELCCATWMKNFVSVGTQAARYQDISLNPQKLAGMCAKLKCCLNYEVDDYVEASRQLPSKDIQLQTQDADYYYFKADILAGLITYSTDKNIAANLETITAERAKQIIEMNRRGEKPDSLTIDGGQQPQGPVDLATQENIARFDRSKKKKKKKNRKPQAPRNEQ